MNDDLERRLDQWGAAPVPDPDPTFIDDLERDLRSQAYFATGAPTPPRRATVLRPALVMGAVLLVALGGWLAVRDSGGDRAEVVMSEATGTFIELPGEAAMAAEPGSALPDGTRISVDRSGSAVVDGVVLGGGTEAVIVDGRIEILITDPTSTPAPTATAVADEAPSPTPTVTARPDIAAPPASPPLTDATSEPTAETPDRPTPSDDARPTPQPTPEPTTRPTPRPTPTARPAQATATPTAPPTEPTPSATPGDGEGAVDIALDIERLGPRRGLLTWLAPRRDDIRGWEVVTITGDRVRTIAVLRDPDIRALRVERPRNLERIFVVRARGAEGVILGESNGVRFPTAGEETTE